MSCGQTDAIRRRLLSGGELGPDDARHVATCAACRRAVSEVERLDARLREAAAGLAAEPIPPEALELDDAGLAAPAFGMPALAGLAAVAVLVAVIVLAIGRAPVAVVPEPSASGSPSPSTSASAAPSPSATPDATPAPTPPPSVPQVDAHLVGPQETCMDGTAGFAVRLPDGWYANRHVSNEPACRTIGTVRDVEGHQTLDPIIYLTVLDAPPEVDPSGVTSDGEVLLPDGTILRRLEVHIPETAAIAAVHEVQYLAPLRDGRTLLATTDTRDATAVEALDATMETLQFTEPIVTDPAVVAEAEALFTDRDVCVDPERGLSVVFPDAWWTNTAVDDLPACSWFAPTSFSYVSAQNVPEEVAITISIIEGSYGTYQEVSSWDSITLFEHPGSRWIIGDGYQYVVSLGDVPDFGPTLLASTGSDPLSRAVLDQLMLRTSFSTPPPGAVSDEPDISAHPVSSEARNGDFLIQLTVEQDRYRAGQPILADAWLTYTGAEDRETLWGSGMGVLFTTVRQVDGAIDPGFAMTTDCVPHEVERNTPLHVPFTKVGSFSGEDPLASFYDAYFRDALLRLPPGRYEVQATAQFLLGGEGCVGATDISLQTSVEILVEP